MTTGEQYTFCELIKRYKIVVPKIQRDYVQGRKNSTVEKNRKEFVEELVDAIKDGKPMSLNFVYGVIRGDDFIPIDGQQRLTTLFLLHLYALAKTEKEKKIEFLKEKFSYQTRYTTNRFIEKLAKNLPAVLKSLKKEENDLCDVIRKAGWYASSWDNDPNVISCLVMLRLIHETWENKINTDKPTEDWKITFMFLRLEEFGSDNRLYIRMNSRGKQLTDFENFKAELYEKVLSDYRDEQAVAIKEFKLKTDGDWYSMLWDAAVIKTEDNRAEDIEVKARLIDALMKRIIHWMIVGKAAEQAKSEGIEATKSKQSKRQQTRAEDEQRKRDRQELLYRYCQPYHERIDILRCDIDQYRALAGYDSALCETFCCDLSNLLNFLWSIQNQGVFRFIANDIFSISQGKKSVTFMIDSYAPRVLLYAVTLFANKTSDQQNRIDHFKSFYRVILNLVSTTEYSPPDFQKAVAAISNWNGDTVKWLNETDFKGAFREAQVKEERVKCGLISNADWKNKILAAENTDFDQDYMPRDYFKGQIGFLLHMAGVGEDRTDNSQQGRLDDFAYYSKAVRCIFDYDNYWSDRESVEITNKPATVDEIEPKTDPSFDNLFHRAMLTKGLYMSDVAKRNGIKTFFVYNDESNNNYDWRGAFRESVGTEEGSCDSQWNIAVTCLKKLLDDFKSECETDAFEFDSFRELLAEKVKNFEEEALTMKDEKEKALCKLLIGKPCCFRYIRNNYYIYRDDATPEYLLMRLKRKRDGSFINITDELIKQGQTL